MAHDACESACPGLSHGHRGDRDTVTVSQTESHEQLPVAANASTGIIMVIGIWAETLLSACPSDSESIALLAVHRDHDAST